MRLQAMATATPTAIPGGITAITVDITKIMVGITDVMADTVTVTAPTMADTAAITVTTLDAATSAGVTNEYKYHGQIPSGNGSNRHKPALLAQ